MHGAWYTGHVSLALCLSVSRLLNWVTRPQQQTSAQRKGQTSSDYTWYPAPPPFPPDENNGPKVAETTPTLLIIVHFPAGDMFPVSRIGGVLLWKER